jgi:hypothetical protein
MPHRLRLVVAAAAAFLPQIALALSGRVYLDAPGKPGVAGVLVSDGTRVVATDAQGRYTLSGTEGRSLVSITVPRDHAAPGGFWRWTGGGDGADFALVRRAQAE